MIKEVFVKSVLNKHKKRDDWFLDDYSVNPYSGCSFNCIYCYIRGSKYGENMRESVSVKVNAVEVLEKQISRRAKKNEYGIIALSSSTEPYMRIEERYRLTRKILEVILKYRFPVEIATKSTLVLRDLDLLKEIDKRGILPEDLRSKLTHKAIISFSISTLNEKLSKVLEPAAPSPIKRLETMQRCKEEGLFVGVNFIPVLPFISDSEEELDNMIRLSKEFGADFVFVGGLTLFGKGPFDSKTLYYEFLERYFPSLIPRYKSLYRIFPMPNKDYQKKIDELAQELADKYGVKYKLI